MPPLEGNIQDLDEKSIQNIVKFVSDVRTGYKITRLQQDRCGHCDTIGTNNHRGAKYKCISSEYSGESLQRLVLAASSRRATLPSNHDLREPIRDHIAELLAELESSTSSICGQAKEHIHADEVILTYGASVVVEKFIKSSGTNKVKLVVVEGPQVAEAAAMAARLSALGVNVTYVNGAAVGALMPRVTVRFTKEYHKWRPSAHIHSRRKDLRQNNILMLVVVGVRAALAGGAVLGEGGLLAVTTAARHYSVPVVVLSPLYKMSPLYSCNHTHFNELAPPYTALPYMSGESAVTQVFAPMYDFVPHDHVTLFVTNLGGSSPSYIYRLLSELYDPNDYQI
ncbi:translation initiation factor eIF-2B subunit beta-like [Colias croceus]|uniref:translation initiation factor eIF-2B subunit beta-like n=1 Tax=Colias crocea TaxID=72248 RepID=UPI001E27E94F|nr:translation initiation factor eIF-2B subunit beta-like [Colias croceus]